MAPADLQSGPVVQTSKARACLFVKGQSGNPSGRPKIPPNVRDAARSLTMTALRTLEEVCANGVSEAARVAAAQAILDRAWGKPQQHVELTGDDGGPVKIAGVNVSLNQLPEDDFRALRALVMKCAVIDAVDANEPASLQEAVE